VNVSTSNVSSDSYGSAPRSDKGEHSFDCRTRCIRDHHLELFLRLVCLACIPPSCPDSLWDISPVVRISRHLPDMWTSIGSEDDYVPENGYDKGRREMLSLYA
jgi:hypothetical protein